MYKIISINNNDYKFEYTIEASLYKDFVDDLMDYITSAIKLSSKNNEIKNGDDAINNICNALKTNATIIPRLAINGFYAGLLENQKLNFEEAKELYKKYTIEYNKTALDVLNEIIEKVEEDNFFKRIGLDLKGMEKELTKMSQSEKTTKKSLKK